MAIESQQLKEHLLQTDHGFRQLVEQHQELDTRLHELAHQHYLSEPEQTEEVTLKKRKLQKSCWKTQIIIPSYIQAQRMNGKNFVSAVILIWLLSQLPGICIPRWQFMQWNKVSM